jgi:type I restriction enzyme R subunit
MFPAMPQSNILVWSAASSADRSTPQPHAAQPPRLSRLLRSIHALDHRPRPDRCHEAFERFRSGDTFTANQIRFVEKVIDYLAKHGSIKAAAVYRAPFADISQSGSESLFADRDADALFERMDQFCGEDLLAGQTTGADDQA